jgi:hypothetical protein
LSQRNRVADANQCFFVRFPAVYQNAAGRAGSRDAPAAFLGHGQYGVGSGTSDSGFGVADGQGFILNFQNGENLPLFPVKDIAGKADKQPERQHGAGDARPEGVDVLQGLQKTLRVFREPFHENNPFGRGV